MSVHGSQVRIPSMARRAGSRQDLSLGGFGGNGLPPDLSETYVQRSYTTRSSGGTGPGAGAGAGAGAAGMAWGMSR